MMPCLRRVQHVQVRTGVRVPKLVSCRTHDVHLFLLDLLNVCCIVIPVIANAVQQPFGLAPVWRSRASFSYSNNCVCPYSTCGGPTPIGASPCELSNTCVVCGPALVCAGASCVPCSAVVATACDACGLCYFNIV